MNRRSILRLLGLAPIAAPAVLAATSKPQVASGVMRMRVRGAEAAWHPDLNADGSSNFSFEGQTLRIPNLVLSATPAA